MVGALSIVRFRTAIKEPLDIAFLFWSIAVGIVLAAGLIPLAGFGPRASPFMNPNVSSRQRTRAAAQSLSTYLWVDMEDLLSEQVHTIDIVMDDWDGFLETCENEEYAQCAVVIDGEAYQNTNG